MDMFVLFFLFFVSLLKILCSKIRSLLGVGDRKNMWPNSLLFGNASDRNK